ncbi:MAG: hypothetical protein IKL84_05030 [Clostridia bacterium]|nr:hypothetical protein [Clostridia bacterium]
MKQTENSRTHTTWIIPGFFALAIVLVCGFAFLSHYADAYRTDTDGGWLSPSDGVVIRHIFLALCFVLAAVVLKLICRNRVRLSMLLLTAVILPTALYHLHYHAYQKDGLLYPLVDRGGTFHFIAIGDYNFDGVNDEQYRILHDERVSAMRYGGHFDDTLIDYIETRAVGVGAGLEGTFCFYDWEERVIDLHLNKRGVDLREIKITVAFRESEVAANAEFYLENAVLPVERHSDSMVTLTFDAVTCAAWQNGAENEFLTIPIEYKIPDWEIKDGKDRHGNETDNRKA